MLPHPYHRSWFGLYGILWLLLASCQGSEWGGQVENALRVPSTERVGAENVGPEIVEPEIVGPDPVVSEAPVSVQPVEEMEEEIEQEESDPIELVEPEPSPTGTAPVSSTSRFEDLGSLAPLTQAAITDLERLGVLDAVEGTAFDPMRSIQRGEFAQWLVLANNALYQGDPSRQIRLSQSPDRPLFLDVPEDHPQFSFVQALGHAGLIEGDAQQEFRPNSLLSRAELIRLKLPVVLPPGPLKGSRADLEQDWGFADADRIPDEAVAAIVADRQAQPSTILHTFGPIRIFHPMDPVSRAEAALALSVMGDQTAAAAMPADPRPILPEVEPDPVETEDPDRDPVTPETSIPEPDDTLPEAEAIPQNDIPEVEASPDPSASATEEVEAEVEAADPAPEEPQVQSPLDPDQIQSAEDDNSGQFITPPQTD
ncbi:MAG: S-layer homology domain-containing protein [Synechococcaceae cyanobacterium SM2_3_2]|nr:S-layer homology domain-containing protein [Synechococcaceae cyanobacterium SM2_3_2]